MFRTQSYLNTIQGRVYDSRNIASTSQVKWMEIFVCINESTWAWQSWGGGSGGEREKKGGRRKGEGGGKGEGEKEGEL